MAARLSGPLQFRFFGFHRRFAARHLRLKAGRPSVEVVSYSFLRLVARSTYRATKSDNRASISLIAQVLLRNLIDILRFTQIARRAKLALYYNFLVRTKTRVLAFQKPSLSSKSRAGHARIACQVNPEPEGSATGTHRDRGVAGMVGSPFPSFYGGEDVQWEHEGTPKTKSVTARAKT